MELEEKRHLLFLLRQAKAILDGRLEDLKVEIENEMKLKRLPDQLQDDLGTARLENRASYEVDQMALRDALLNGSIAYDDLYQHDCISFRGAEIYKRFPELVSKEVHSGLVVKLEKLDLEKTIGVLCQIPKHWRENG